MAIRSAVNWHEKWYWLSNLSKYMSELGYLVFSKAWAMVHCKYVQTIKHLENLITLYKTQLLMYSQTDLSNSQLVREQGGD